MTATPETADQYQDQPQPGQSTQKTPAGFRFGAVAGGVKPSGKTDVSVIVGDGDLVAAGVYTTNAVVAAPVLWCRDRTPATSIRAVATVSGNANACTGETGIHDTAAIAALVAHQIGCQSDQVLVMCTGIIGQTLPMTKVNPAFESACKVLQTGGGALANVAQAICTTDAGPKTASASMEMTGGEVQLSMIAKGAGMIAPNMATMLAVAMTDADLRPDDARDLLRRVADRTLNRITVDGHASTNDTFLLLASGAAGDGPLRGDDLQTFEQNLERLAADIGRQIVADGEGATHYMHLSVEGAVDDDAAAAVARHTAQSLLVKTAVTGNDPNWGRIVSAAGAAGQPMEVEATCLWICDVEIYRNGEPIDFDASVLSKKMASAVEVPVRLQIGRGGGTAEIWSSDLTTDYVSFNSEYTT